MKKKNVVVIGGGTGLSRLLRGLKYVEGIDISAIVTVADDGGSTGTLRDEHKLPAMGDIRRVICALSHNRPLLEEIMEYRFSGEFESTGKHSLGNLILTAMTDLNNGSFSDGVDHVSEVLNIEGKVIPVSDEYLTLVARYEDGSIKKGEHQIPDENKKITEVFYDGEPMANASAVNAIKNADYIIFSMGSLYTSIMANVAIPDIRKALLKNKDAEKVYIANIVTQPGETDALTIDDHVQAINNHVGAKDYIGVVITTNVNNISKELIEKYENEKQYVLVDDTLGKNYKVFNVDVIDSSEKDLIRHSDRKMTLEAQKLFDRK